MQILVRNKNKQINLINNCGVITNQVDYNLSVTCNYLQTFGGLLL